MILTTPSIIVAAACGEFYVIADFRKRAEKLGQQWKKVDYFSLQKKEKKKKNKKTNSPFRASLLKSFPLVGRASVWEWKRNGVGREH